MFLLELLQNSRYVQYLSALSAGIAPLIFSTLTSWPSPSLPLLTSVNSPIGITLSNEEASWVTASLFLGMIPGSIVQGLLFDKLGPKGVLILSSVVLLIPWILIVFAQSIWLLVVGRFIGGIGASIAMSSTPIYVCEIASKDIRGILGVIPAFTSIIGVIAVYSIGPFVSYITLASICVIFPLLQLFSLLFAPNSPYFLLKNGREEDAKKNLVRLCGSSTSTDQIDEMLREMNETLERDTGHKSLTELLLTLNFRKSLLVVLVLLSGLLIDRMGRKLLFSISAFGACVSLLGEGTYFYLQGKVNLESVNFLPITFLTLYRILISLGISYLPYFIIGELFTMDTKKIGTLIFSCYAGIIGFLNSKLFSTVTSAWGLYTACWFFAGVCALGVLFGVYFIPETKGKTFADIQDSLSSRKK
ncbi:hypothetical protein RI129_009637 [Pyrocoelia pectoralis]|uniref:Major facilitator superfamily (MFS) profile domain-containing protein n=1 Tax=Pyrocoelia pectoralis TaxID=417401 RepID=A0AAN7ZCE9_9COLE